jgi:hypothetical protein
VANKKHKVSETSKKLDWHKFNLLENMLIFCALPEKSVPKESGVHFRITLNKNCDCICLLFEIDRKKDPLIRDKIPRPDFLVLYIDREKGCLFTIIEMKGTTLDGGKHAVEQITTFYDLLRKEIKDNLPTKFKPKFQAIILTPNGTETPNPLIARVSREKGFTIRPVQDRFKAELFDYISQDVKIVLENRKAVKKYVPNQKFNNQLKSLESKLTLNALPNRKDDKFCEANKDKATNKEGIYINYNLPNEEYAALAIDNSGMKIGVKEAAKKFIEKIQADLKKIGLNSSQYYSIEKIN